MFSSMFSFFHNPSTILVLKILYYLSFVLVPLGLFFLIVDLWVMYRRQIFMGKLKYKLLEVKLPRDIFKSPRAMEFFINALSQPFGEGNWYLKFWQGSVRPWFSLEIVSIEGSIHFFIWAREGYKNQIEANLYSQYPGIEIYEVPDYTLPVSFDPATTGLFACEFLLTKPDVYPIKTYIDYGMDSVIKEEYKIDPLTPLIEYLGTLGKGHQAWIQMVIRTHLAEDKDPKTNKKVDLKWKDSLKGEMNKIFEKTKLEKKEGDTKEERRLNTKGEVDVISALERSISKTGFDVGMRAIYVAPKDIFAGGNIGGIIGGITHFNSNELNGFRPDIAGGKYTAPKWEVIGPLKRWKEKKTIFQKQRMLDAYKRRAYFYPPFKRQTFVLNTEELATIWHFPGSVSATPTFTRIESRKSEAPANLPI